MQVGQARAEYFRWLRITRDVSPHTLRAYEGDVAAFERHVGADALVSGIDRDCIVGFLEAQRAAGLSATSIRRRASGVRGFSRWLLTSELIEGDPFAGASVAVGRSRRLPRLLAAQDLDRLFAWLRQRAGVGDLLRGREEPLDRPHETTTLLGVALMVATGARVNEVVSLRCHDIDLPARSMRIVGKGRRERQVFLTNEWIKALTRSYLATRVALGVDHQQLLFNCHRAPLTAAAMRARVVKAARDAGVRARVTPHMLRHTAATQLIEAGVDIRYIQRLLGHASLSTTEIYTHVSDGALRRVVSDADVLGRVLGGR